MILRLSLTQFTFLHVFLSLVGIATGVFIIFGLLKSLRLSILTSLFFVTTILTSVTGFFYPFKGITPGIILGILSLIVLLIAIIALYVKKLAGSWRAIYVVTICLAFYFNFFVLVAQAFQKVPALHTIAPSNAAPRIHAGAGRGAADLFAADHPLGEEVSSQLGGLIRGSPVTTSRRG